MGDRDEPLDPPPTPNDVQATLVRNFVNNLGTRAVNLYSYSKDATPQLAQDGISEIEARLKVLKAPLWNQWQSYGDPLITKADETISRAILSPARTMETQFHRAVQSVNDVITQSPQQVMQHMLTSAQTASRDLLVQHMQRVRSVSQSSASGVSQPQSQQLTGPEDTAHQQQESYSILEPLRQKISERIQSYQHAVQMSPHTQPIRVVLLGLIADYYACAMKLIEAYRHRVGSVMALPSVSRVEPAPITSLVHSLNSLFASLRGVLGLSSAGDHEIDTPLTDDSEDSGWETNEVYPSIAQHRAQFQRFSQRQSPQLCQQNRQAVSPVHSRSTDSADESSPNHHFRYNPGAPIFVPGCGYDLSDTTSLGTDLSHITQSSETSVEVNPSKPHQAISVIGKRTEGLTAEDSANCLIAVSTLRTMLEERKGAPLKQPGLSRKLYARDPTLKDAINNAGGLRAFVKRFPDEFRLFPGKGTVWFVTLRDSSAGGLSEDGEEREDEGEDADE